MNNYWKKKNVFFFRIYDICKYKFKNKIKSFKTKNTTQQIIFPINCFDLKKYIAIVVIFQFHDFPHLLLIRNKQNEGIYCLPGGRLNIKNNINYFLKCLLGQKLSIKYKKISSFVHIGNWIFPEIENRIKYSYYPSHFKKKNIDLDIYLVEIKILCNFEVNTKWNIIAVPLFEINENHYKYGLIISKLPFLLILTLFNLNKKII